jgi:uncharacterized protein (TIGR02646 family)
MRPVIRGEEPLDSDGNPIQFNEYKYARDYLISRIGDYCSYCEAPLFTPAIEHIQPKAVDKNLITQWHNFLFACTYCNSSKGKKNTSELSKFFWPDQDNTFRVFIYENGNTPKPNSNLTQQQQEIARNTIELTGLERRVSSDSRDDRRYIKRNEAFQKAEEAKADLKIYNNDLVRRRIVEQATSTGFWSVWMTVFQDDADMRRLLIGEFKGTCPTCFDSNTQAIQRPGGQI